MEELKKELCKEAKKIAEGGLSTAILSPLGEIVDMYKDLTEVEQMEETIKAMRSYGDEYGYMGYGAGGYNAGRGGYRGYGEYDGEGYGRRGVAGSGRGRYGHFDERMMERLDRIMDGADMYQYGRDRYHGGDTEERMYDGLEKLMYAICTFVESTMDFAETPQEKEIIRKHMQKLAKL